MVQNTSENTVDIGLGRFGQGKDNGQGIGQAGADIAEHQAQGDVTAPEGIFMFVGHATSADT